MELEHTPNPRLKAGGIGLRMPQVLRRTLRGFWDLSFGYRVIKCFKLWGLEFGMWSSRVYDWGVS